MKKVICCILIAFALLLGACQSPQIETEIPDAEIFVTEESGNFVLCDSEKNLIPFEYSHRYPNGNCEFHLTDGRWFIFDPDGEVLYDDIDAVYSNYHVETYLEDGTTLYRYFDPSGDLLLEGVGKDYADWHYTGLATCFFRFEDDTTLVKNFATGQEVQLPFKADFSTFTTAMAEATGRILFGDYENNRSFLVDEEMSVSELEGFFAYYQDEDGKDYLMRSDHVLCDLDGTHLPVPDIPAQEEDSHD